MLGRFLGRVLPIKAILNEGLNLEKGPGLHYFQW
jgi:hypothetical protein